MAELNVTEPIEDLRVSTWKSSEAPKHIKCVSKCYMEKLGIINATTGVLLMDVVKVKFSKDLEPILSNCKQTISSDPCETGYSVMKCLAKQYEPDM